MFVDRVSTGLIRLEYFRRLYLYPGREVICQISSR